LCIERFCVHEEGHLSVDHRLPVELVGRQVAGPTTSLAQTEDSETAWLTLDLADQPADALADELRLGAARRGRDATKALRHNRRSGKPKSFASST